MSSSTHIQILNPMPKSKLGRHRGKVGAFIIRYKDQVLYVGCGNDVYSSCCRYFRKGGSLQSYEIQKVSFEILLCSSRKAKTITRTLRTYLRPNYNNVSMPLKLNKYEKKQHIRLLNFYRQDSFFESTEGEHKTDK